VDMLVIRSVRVVIDGWDALHLGFERTQDANGLADAMRRAGRTRCLVVKDVRSGRPQGCRDGSFFGTSHPVFLER